MPEVTWKNTPPVVQRVRVVNTPEDEVEEKEKNGCCGFDVSSGIVRNDSLMSTPRMKRVRGRVCEVSIAVNSPITRTTSSDK